MNEISKTPRSELRTRILGVLADTLGHETAVEVLESYEAKLIEEFARPPVADLEHTWDLARGKRRLSKLERQEAP